MNRSAILIATLLIGGAIEVEAQSFTFASTLRAGSPNNGNNNTDWQIGLASSTSAQTATAFFDYNGTNPPYWNQNGSQRFEIGWNATTNRAYTVVYNSNGIGTRVEQPNTGVQLNSSAVWTLPASGFVLQAARNNGNNGGSIELTGLTFSSGVNLRSGALPSPFSVTQGSTATQVAMASPIVLDAAGSQGSWFLAGNIRFSGLTTFGQGNARGSDLQFLLNATGQNTPEPASLALLGGGLLLMAMVGRTGRFGKRV